MLDKQAEYRQRDVAVVVLGCIYATTLCLSSLAPLPPTRYYLIAVTISLIGLVFLIGFESGIRLCSYLQLRRNDSFIKRAMARWSVLLVASVFVWLASLAAPQLPTALAAAWQLPLVGGGVFGYYNPQVTEWWYGVDRPLRVLLLVLVAVGSVLGYLASQSMALLIGLVGSAPLPPGMILLSAGWIVAGYHGLKYLEGQLAKLWQLARR